MSDKSVLICVGPAGVGYFTVVDKLPSRDAGVEAMDSGAILICDAAIVARILSESLHVELITNGLGPLAESRRLRQMFSSCVIREQQSQEKKVPFDVIALETSTGARTYITTHYFPETHHIVDQFNRLAGRLGKAILYADLEVGTAGGAALLAAITSFAPSEFAAALLNVGRVERWEDLVDWIRGVSLGDDCILQVSFGGREQDLANNILRTLHRDVFGARDGAIIVTQGGQGATLVSRSHIHVVHTRPINDALTVGAGAVFSSAILTEISVSGSADISRRQMAKAARAARSYVQHFTTRRSFQPLDLWSD